MKTLNLFKQAMIGGSVLASVALAIAGGSASAQQLHGAGSLNPKIYSPDPEMPSKKGEVARGFARLFTLKKFGTSSSSDEAIDPGLLPHASPIYDLRALGEKMIEPTGFEDDPAGNAEMPAGYTFFGQFIDHDITLDTVSKLTERAEDSEFANARTVDLDLDCVYGGGPDRDPYLYNLPYLRVGAVIYQDTDSIRHDLIRTESGTGSGADGGDARALIGDPRNDENFVLSELQAAFVAFHNKMVDHLADAEGITDVGALPSSKKSELFETAHDHTVHYYHRVIVEDFLPRLIGINRTLDLVTNGRTFYFPNGFVDEHGTVKEPFIPIEFSVAAYRYGHSQVRQIYQLQMGGTKQPLFQVGDGGTMREIFGFRPIEDDFVIDWQYFFDIGATRPADGLFNHARVIDPELPSHLHMLEMVNVVGDDDLGSLAARNLNRGRIFRLPSGQDIARVILAALDERELPNGESVITIWEVSNDLGGFRPAASPDELILEEDQLTRETLGPLETPLWYYILQESREFGNRAVQSGAQALVLSSEQDGESQAEFYKQSREIVDEAIERAARQQPVYKAIKDVIIEKDEAARSTDATVAAAAGGAVSGHTLGPVGGTLVGELFLGLIEHYRDKTSKGLDFVPTLCAAPLPDDPTVEATCPLTALDLDNVGGRAFGIRYQMGNLLHDAGVAGAIDPVNF